jgi:Ion channel
MHMKADDLQRYLARARERFGDRLLTWLTLLLVVLTFVIVPLHAAGLIVTQGYVFAIVLVMASCIVGAPAGVGAVIAMLFGVALAVAAVVARLMDHRGPAWFSTPPLGSRWSRPGLRGCPRGVCSRPRHLSSHHWRGAALSDHWPNIRRALWDGGLVVTHSLSGVSVAEAPKLLSDLIYFSFSMLTTVGYGDIVPVHPIARCLTSVELIIGQLSTLLLCGRGLSPWGLKTAAGNQAIML